MKHQANKYKRMNANIDKDMQEQSILNNLLATECTNKIYMLKSFMLREEIPRRVQFP